MKKPTLFLICGLMAATATGQVKVKSESLPVHQSASASSAVVKTLKQGDEVVLDMSIAGADKAQWCMIREDNQADLLGYVPCNTLERSAPRPAYGAATKTGKQPVAAKAAPKAAPKGDWDPTQARTAGETRWLGYGTLIAETFKFTQEQKLQMGQLAIKNGMPACAQNSDSYFSKGVNPPDLTNTSPITPCHWYAQYYAEQVFALVTPEQKAARQASYNTFSKEVASNRRVIELRAQGK